MYTKYIEVEVPQERSVYIEMENPRNKEENLTNVSSETRYILKQKLSGILLIVLGLLSVIFSGGDGTAFIFFAFIGIFLLTTKHKVMMFKEWENGEEVE